MGPLAKEALKLFYKKFGKRIANTVAESKWIADKIKELSKITQKVATKVRKQLQKEKRKIPKEWNKFKPEIVKPIKVPEQTKNILNIKSTLKGRPVKVVPEPKKGIETILPKFLHAGKGKKGQKLFFDPETGKILEETVVGPAKIIYGRFPKKPPRKPKADGGSIDKTLPGRSRDI